MQKVVVVIPVHKSSPTHCEIASLKQCYKILYKHPIKILAPKGLNMLVYQNAIPNPEIIRIDPDWLSSIEQYNKLKVNQYFYNLFSDYEFLLTYELDAWVFRDELEYWCSKAYDFIGAPWFEGFEKPVSKKNIRGANSGFSLRKIKSVKKIFQRRNNLRYVRNLWFRFRIQSLFKFEKNVLVKRFFKIRSLENINDFLFEWKAGNEDIFWSKTIPSLFPDFSIPEFSTALRFSFEVNPSYLFQLSNNELPFGCHAWEKYEPYFWEQFIPEPNRKNA